MEQANFDLFVVRTLEGATPNDAMQMFDRLQAFKVVLQCLELGEGCVPHSFGMVLVALAKQRVQPNERKVMCYVSGFLERLFVLQPSPS